MSPVMTEADRIRVSDDMVGVTTDLVAAMLKSNMVSKERLPDYVRDIHSALIDISFESLSILGKIEATAAALPAAPATQERRLPSAQSIKQAVDQLLDRSTTVFEPPVPYQVRVPQSSPRPSAPKAAPEPRQPPAPLSPRKAASEEPVQASLPLPEAAPAPAKPWSGEERRTRPLKAKSKPLIETMLPPRLSSIEEALALDYIVCLEDGKKVKDLGEHLARLGMSPDAYREKWKLPAEYPMMAPSAIAKRAEVYEIDLVTGKVHKSR